MIHLDGHRLNLDQIWQIAVQKRRCAICLDALPGMKKSRALVETFDFRFFFNFIYFIYLLFYFRLTIWFR